MSENPPGTSASTVRPSWVGVLRVAIGFGQGLAVHFLGRVLDPPGALSQDPGLGGLSAAGLTGLFVVALLVPFVALSGLSLLPARILVRWLVAAGAVLFGLGAWLGYVYFAPWRGFSNTFPGIFLLSLALFMAHHLVLASARSGRLLAPYAEYFDRAWKSLVQMILAAGFALAGWLLLWMSAALFEILGVTMLKQALQEPVIAISFTFTMFAAAVHLTDQRADLVLGARNLGLNLLGWLTPPMAVLTLIFVALLPFGGIHRLWSGGPGSGLLIAAAIVLIVLVNCLWQDGVRVPGRILGWSARVAAALVAPLVVLAVIGVSLRVADLGWTRSRIFVAAILVMLVLYGASYLWAARPKAQGLLPGLGTHNVRAAWLATALLLVLGSPLGDPARLAVADQVQRLHSGKTRVEDFDFRFLARAEDSGRWGKAALGKLAALSGDARNLAIAAQARAALADRAEDEAQQARSSDREPVMTAAVRRRRIENLTGNPDIPDEAFGPYMSGEDPATFCDDVPGPDGAGSSGGGTRCELRRLDLLPAIDRELVLLVGGEVSVVVPGGVPGVPWRRAVLGCCVPGDAFAIKDFRVVDLPVRGVLSEADTFVFNFNPKDIELLISHAGSAPPKASQAEPKPGERTPP